MKVHISNCAKGSKYHYVNLIGDALESLGHEVFRFCNDDYSSSYLKIDQVTRRSPLFLLTKKKPEYFDFKQKYKDFISKNWLKTIKEFNPDLLLVINTSWLSKNAVKIAKENFHIPKMAGWFVDHPGVPAAEDVVSYLPYFDTLFSIDPAWIPFISFFNKNVFYLPLATSDIYYKPLNQARNLDFVFAANFFVNDPAGYLKAFIISHLPPTYKVEIYGPDINYFKNIYPQLKNFKCYNEILGTRINDVWNSAKLTAVIYHPQVIAGTAPRIFDCALSKTPQIIQETSTIYDLFSGVNLPTFKSIPEFLSKTDYYLNHLKEREELAEAMYKITKQKHLFIHRIKTMMELLNLK